METKIEVGQVYEDKDQRRAKHGLLRRVEVVSFENGLTGRYAVVRNTDTGKKVQVSFARLTSHKWRLLHGPKSAVEAMTAVVAPQELDPAKSLRAEDYVPPKP